MFWPLVLMRLSINCDDSHLTSLLVRRWLPDDVVFVDAMTLGSTGKIDKKELRAKYAL